MSELPPLLGEQPSGIYDDLTELDPSPMVESPTGSVRSSSRSYKPSNPHNCNHDNQNGNRDVGLNDSQSSSHHNQSHHQAPPFGKLSLWLTRTQRYSSYAFTSFLSLHFTTTALVPLVTRSSDSSLLLARTVYQSQPTLEYLLIPCSLGVHILSGVGLRLRRHYLARKRYGQAPSFWARRSWSPISVAGWILVPPLAAHAVVLRIVPLFVDGSSADVGLGYVAHGFAYHNRRLAWWLNAGFYTGFVTVACFHVVNGLTKFLRLDPSPPLGAPALHRRTRRRTVLTIFLLTGTWLGSLFGVILRPHPTAAASNTYLAQKYDEFYDFVFGRLMVVGSRVDRALACVAQAVSARLAALPEECAR